MRAVLGLTIPLLLLTAAFTTSVPTAAAQDGTFYLVSGRVTSDEGKPLAGVIVNGYTYEDGRAKDSPYAHAETRTDEDGRYALKLAAGKGWVNVHYEKWRQSEGREIEVSKNTTVDFTLKTPPPKDAIIEGRVVDKDGNPVADAQVSLNYRCCYIMPAEGTTAESKQASGSDAVAPSRIMPPQHDDSATVTTGADGRFRFEAYEGPRQISVYAKGFAHEQKEIEAVSGQTTTVEIVLLKVPAADATIEGRVVDAQTGLPLAGAQVSVRSLEWGRYAWAETGKDGTYSLKTVPGWAEVSVHYYERHEPMPLAADGIAKPAIAPAPTIQYYPSMQILDLASGDRDLDVKLQPKPKPTVALIGYVVDPETKKAVPDARVSVWSHDGGDWGEAVTDATGSYKIMVRPGHYSANAWKEGYLSGAQTFVVRDVAAERYDILMPKGTTRWAPCYDDECGPIAYATDARSAGAEESPPQKVATTGGAPAPEPAPGMVAPQTLAARDADGSDAQAPGGDRGAATFAGSGGGLPEYDPEGATTPPAAEHASAPSEVPAGGIVLALLALAGVAALAARRG